MSISRWYAMTGGMLPKKTRLMEHLLLCGLKVVMVAPLVGTFMTGVLLMAYIMTVMEKIKRLLLGCHDHARQFSHNVKAGKRRVVVAVTRLLGGVAKKRKHNETI